MNNAEYSANPIFQTVRHGKKYLERCNSPSMFDLLTWPEQTASQNLKSNHQPRETFQTQKAPLNQYTLNPYKRIQTYPTFNTHENIKINPNIFENNEQLHKNRINQQQYPQSSKIKGHEIQKQLYYYGQPGMKREKKEELENFEEFRNRPKKKRSVKKLDENDPDEKVIIQGRKKVIKEFKQNSRDLPNSAFTTYYGKPAFQQYGYLATDQYKRTHNVMPHKFQNNPSSPQSYVNALVRAKSASHYDTIPRKPLYNQIYIQKPEENSSRYQLEPFDKPDLINNIRFSSPQQNTINLKNRCCKGKQKVPSHISTYKNSRKIQMLYDQKRRKLKSQLKRTMSTDDGLKYFSPRDNLFEQIQDKKSRDRRLPYKVTECYPEGWPQQHPSLQQQEYGIKIPAGTRNIQSQSAKNVIYGYN